MPYNMPYPSQPTNEVTNNQPKADLITHMPHPIIDNNQIMPNPHGHHSYNQDVNLTNLPANTLAPSNHLNSTVDINADASYYSLSSIGNAGYNEQQISVKKRKRDLPNDELNWYGEQPDTQDVKLIQSGYDSSNNLYAPDLLHQSNSQLPPQKAIFNNNNYANYMDPNDQWTNNSGQNLPSNNYHYAEQQQQQQIGQLTNIGQPVSGAGYMSETIYDSSNLPSSLPPMSQLRGNSVPHTPNYLPADQTGNQFQSIDNSQLHIQPNQGQGVLMEGDFDDALNILKEHAEIPNFNQQSSTQLSQLDHHLVQSSNDVSASMPSLSTNTVSTTSNLDDKVGSSNAFLRQKMNSTNSNLNNLGKGSKRSRSSRK